VPASPSPRGPRAKKQRSARDIEKGYPARQFAAKLRRLADAVESGKAFSLQVAGERLHIPADALFNIEHERAGGVDEVEFQLRWRR
jgi:amphi-Trp domain-containing protein